MRHWRAGWLSLVFGGTALLLAALTIYYSRPAARFFVVEAETAGLQLVAGGQPMSVWRLPGVTVCRWRKDDYRRTGPAPPDCAGEQFEIVRPDSLDFSWPLGTALDFAPGADGAILATLSRGPANEGGEVVLPGGLTLTTGSLLVIPAAALTMNGPLIFSGTDLAIGALPKAGRSGLLSSGQFRSREILRFRTAPATILEGGFLPGDRISFGTAVAAAKVASYGTIERVRRQGAPPLLKIVAFSEPGLTHIVAKRLGASDASDLDPATWIVPDWTDRIRNDPLGLAIVAVLGLGGAILSGVASIVTIFASAREGQAPSAKPAERGRAASGDDAAAPLVAAARTHREPR